MNWAPCSNPRCDNKARYTSGYCGLCDLEFNEGKGRKLTDVLAEHQANKADTVYFTEEFFGFNREPKESEAMRYGRELHQAIEDYHKILEDHPVAEQLGLGMGKYTRRYAKLTNDQIYLLLWLLGEFTARAMPSDITEGHPRMLNAFKLLLRFHYTPMDIDEYRKLMMETRL